MADYDKEIEEWTIEPAEDPVPPARVPEVEPALPDHEEQLV